MSDYDFFISHASEDKQSFVRALADKLVGLGYRVWLDELTLTLGDSLRGSIDKGLGVSRYGIVVLSPNFIKKNWTKGELDGLFALENSSGKKRILPVWHNITKEEVEAFSPMLAGRLGVLTTTGLDNVVARIVEVIEGTDTAGGPVSENVLAVASDFQDIIQSHANLSYAECTLDISLTSFEGYDISELYPMYRNCALRLDSNNVVLPFVMNQNISTMIPTPSDIILQSEDHLPRITNHFLYDKLVLSGNRIRYASIEFVDGPVYMNTRFPMLNMLQLLVMLERLHKSEGMGPNVTLAFKIYAPQRASMGSTLFDVTSSIFKQYWLRDAENKFTLVIADFGNQTIQRFVNRIYGLFRDEKPGISDPFVRVERPSFEERIQRIKMGAIPLSSNHH